MKKSEKRIYPYLIIFGIALSWHVFWWLVLRTEPFPEIFSPKAKAVKYLQSANSRSSLWGPILFSLPSQSGFSASLIKSREPSEPPLQYSESLEVFSARSTKKKSHPVSFSWEARDLHEDALHHVEQAPPVEESIDPYFAAEVLESSVLSLTYDGGVLEDLDLNAMFDSNRIPAARGKLFLDIDLNAQRWAESIRVISPTPSSEYGVWVAHVVQKLYQTQIPLPLTDSTIFKRSIRLSLIWEGHSNAH